MDFSDPQQWKDAASLIWGMPQVVLPFFGLAVVLSFLAGKRTASESLADIKERASKLKRQNDTVNQKLGLASDKEQKVAESLQEAEIELSNLRFRISELAGSVPGDKAEMLTATAALVAENMREVALANSELRHILWDDRVSGEHI